MKNEHTQVPHLDRSAPFMDDIVVSKDGVTKLLKGLDPSKALEPNELHPRVLKELTTADWHQFNTGTENTIQISKFKRIGFEKKKKKKKNGGFRWGRIGW